MTFVDYVNIFTIICSSTAIIFSLIAIRNLNKSIKNMEQTKEEIERVNRYFDDVRTIEKNIKND